MLRIEIEVERSIPHLFHSETSCLLLSLILLKRIPLLVI